ncbi:MAG TPA: phosphoribosylanthranilate isomerase [Chromatiales bacterium]|nr:phosphoribosylanthranilate isomerase [Chromatiales bacterium]
MRTRVKICGITRLEDALAAAGAGADALGFVFYPPSPRNVEVERAAEITAALPPFVTTVALFVNADAGTIAEVVREARIDLLQFHGNECPDYCAQHGRPWIKAIRMKEGVDPEAEARRYAGAQALLLDAYRPGVPGGTGEAFDWDRIPSSLAPRIVLAGGLTPENVAEAVRRVRPWAVDVSGGVEAAPGVKDADKIERFLRGVTLGQA